MDRRWIKGGLKVDQCQSHQQVTKELQASYVSIGSVYRQYSLSIVAEGFPGKPILGDMKVYRRCIGVVP